MSRWEEILTEHLATTPLARSPEGWIYKQRLIGTFWYRIRLRAFWASQPEMIRVYLDGTPRLQSLNDLRSRAITTVTPPPTPGETTDSTALVPAWDNSLPTLIDGDIAFLSYDHHEELFRQRGARNVRQLTTGHVAIDWETISETDRGLFGPSEFFEPAALPWTGIGFAVHRPKHGRIMLSTSHPFVQWMKRVGTACAQGRNSLRRDEGWRLFNLVHETTRNSSSNIGDLVRHINVWRTHPNLPPDLLPPDITLKPDMFRFWPDKKSD